MADFQRAKAAVEGLLEPGFDQRGETPGLAAAEERQADEVLREGAQVLQVSVDAGQPAAPDWPLWLVLPGNQGL